MRITCPADHRSACGNTGRLQRNFDIMMPSGLFLLDALLLEVMATRERTKHSVSLDKEAKFSVFEHCQKGFGIMSALKSRRSLFVKTVVWTCDTAWEGFGPFASTLCSSQQTNYISKVL